MILHWFVRCNIMYLTLLPGRQLELLIWSRKVILMFLTKKCLKTRHLGEECFMSCGAASRNILRQHLPVFGFFNWIFLKWFNKGDHVLYIVVRLMPSASHRSNHRGIKSESNNLNLKHVKDYLHFKLQRIHFQRPAFSNPASWTRHV